MRVPRAPCQRYARVRRIDQAGPNQRLYNASCKSIFSGLAPLAASVRRSIRHGPVGATLAPERTPARATMQHSRTIAIHA